MTPDEIAEARLVASFSKTSPWFDARQLAAITERLCDEVVWLRKRLGEIHLAVTTNPHGATVTDIQTVTKPYLEKSHDDE